METKSNKSRKTLLIAVAAVLVLAVVVILGLILSRCDSSEPDVSQPMDESTAATEETTAASPEVPALVWDMEALPENLIAEGMAYANSNDNVYGNLIIGAAPGKGLCGSQAFAYTFVGDYSSGDVFVMSPKSLKDPNFVSDWTNGQMLWFWVNGTELMQNVRLEIVVNGLYTPYGSLYYTINEAGECVEVGQIPRAWGSTTKRGRIQISAGWEGWIGIPLETFNNPEVISSIQIHVGNSTIKAGNVLYLDEFWLTKLYEVPPLTLEELNYKSSDSLTLGQIWNLEDAQSDTEVGKEASTDGRNDVKTTVAGGKGVLGSNALSYAVQETTQTQTQNVELPFVGLQKYGATLRGIKDQTDIIWFWVDSDLSSDQLLHVQLNGVFMDDNKGIYTIVSSNGVPSISKVEYYSSKGTVNGLSVVPYDGKTEGKYARIEISQGWSGWIGIPVENFCVNSDGTAAEMPSGMVSKLTFRLFGGKDSFGANDTLYFDEFWITAAGEMPALSDEALTYGYTGSFLRPTVRYGRIWNAEGSGISVGTKIGEVDLRNDWNAITSTIAAGKGVCGSNALAYRLTKTGGNNSANVLLETAKLEAVDFKTAVVTKASDVLWFWVDSAVGYDQLLHMQVNSRLMTLGKSIYTISEENGKAVLKEIQYTSDGALVTGGIGLVPSNGKAETDSTTYARIKLCDGWSGWIGIPVENFGTNTDGTIAGSSLKKLEKFQIRSYVTNKNVLSQGDLLYFDEFWLTKEGQMPDLSTDELLYGYTAYTEAERITYGQIWDADDAKTGTTLGDLAADTDKNKISSVVVDGKGVSGASALNYKLLSAEYANSNNVTLEAAGLAEHGFKLASVTEPSDILWLWVDSAVDYDQLLHLQVNGRLIGLGTSIYTIVDVNGVAAMQEVPYTYDAALISGGIGLVPSNGKEETESTAYARVKLCDGWSGWIGIPVKNFNVQSNVTVDTVIERIDKLQIRSYVTNSDVLTTGDALYFDELWLTKAGKMPDLSNAELLYGYTTYDQIEKITYGQIWDASDAEAGAAVGAVAADTDKNTVSSVVVTDKGVLAKSALNYQLLDTGYTNGNNVTLEVSDLAKHGFKLASVTAASDILWLWVDSAVDYDQLLHLQVNGRLMGLGTTVYTIVDVDGTATLQQIVYTADGSAVTDGIGLVPSNGKTASSTTTYSRIKLCDGWSGWIGIPVGNFNVQSNATVDTVIERIDKFQIRSYVTDANVLTAGDTLYFDEIWLTQAGQMPGLGNEELLYGYSAAQTDTGGVWNAEHESLSYNGQILSGMIGADSSRNSVTAGVYQELGVLGSNALGYRLTTVNKTQSNNMDVSSANLSRYGYNTSAIQDSSDILWFWVCSDLSSDQLLHVQLNNVKVFLDQADIYTIGEEDGQPVMQTVEWYGTSASVPAGELGVVYPNGTSGSYARVLVRSGWSGWIGIPVENFCVDSNGNSADVPSGQVENVIIRLYGTSNSLHKDDTIYFDEFWITRADALPDLDDDALLYTYTEPVKEFTLSARYESGMIFQHGKPWQIHGTGIDGQTVTVTLLKGSQSLQTASCVVADGSWSVIMDAVKVEAGDYDTYTVKVSNGNETQLLDNVAFGEVWVTGGQSNMFYTIAETDNTMFNANEDVAALKARLTSNEKASYIRMYTQGTPTADFNGEHTDANGSWGNASDWSAVEATSAVAMHYAEQLQAKLDMPVGVVVAARGGTSIGTWVDLDVVEQQENGSYKYAEFYELLTDLGYFDTASAQYHVAGYFNSTVAPFQGYEVAGLLWYQGEQDRFEPEMQTYGFEVLVESWSKVFTTAPETVSDTALDVIAIQIAPFVGYDSDGDGVYADEKLVDNSNLNAAMREGAAAVQANGGNVVLVPIYDLSAIVDDHHPLNKKDVADRVIQVAFETYYDAVEGNESYSGPQVTAIEYQDDKVVITFDQTIQCIPLTKENNDRITKEGIYVLPDESELWGTALNGFSIYTGTEYVSVDAKLLNDTQVELTLQENVSVAGVCYAYSLETLSANLYDADGLPALPFCAVREGYAMNHQTKLWSADEVEAVIINASNGRSGRNTSKISIADGEGLSATQGLKYELVTAGNERTHTWNSTDLSVYGFRTGVTAASDEDIIWFWASAVLSTQQRLQISFNDKTIKTDSASYIYTILAGDDGEPEMVRIPFGGTDTVEGISLVQYNATEAQILMDPGWYGWIGIPANVLNSNSVTAGTAVTKLGVLLLQKEGDLTAQQVGDAVILDEFWMTSPNTMPELTDEELLCTNAKSSEETDQADEKQELIWNAENVFLTDGYDLSAYASTNFDKVQAKICASTGVSGSNSLAYSKATNTNSQSSNITLKPELPGFNSITIAETDVLWFWVDSELDSDRLLHVQLNSSFLNKEYIYTIVSNSGAAAIQRIEYDPAGVTEGDGLALIASGGDASSSATYARIRLDAGWCGWIGIPVSCFDGNSTSVPTDSVTSIVLRLAGGKGLVNETVYFDEFWLTEEGQMPDLSNEALLYDGDPAAVQQAAPFLSVSDTLTGDLKSKSYYSETASNNQPTSYFIFEAAAGKGYNGTNAFSVGFAGENPGNYTNWANLDITDETAKAELNIGTNTGISSDATLWLWVDGTDLSADARINFKVNGQQNKLGGYYYTVEQTASGYAVSDKIALVVSGTNSTGTASAGTEGNIPVSKGFQGWIGVPLSNYVSTETVDITKLNIHLKKTGSGSKHTAGSCVYISDFFIGQWLGTTWELPVAE